MTNEIKKPKLAELCIDVRSGQAVVTKDGTIEFNDCGESLTLGEMEYILEEAKEFIKYRESRNGVNDVEKKECKEKPIILEKTLDFKWKDSNFEGAGEFGEALYNIFNEYIHVDNIPYTVTMLRNIKPGSKVKCIVRLEVNGE